ncbi:hypothetical protein PVAND_014037 [Polypedilum vanderplanki]|uniref:Zinc finger protein n=1 Tax=Polypedilum vanderplanki TaxID=319348 RepID=A0A9J6CRJ8_POLVA|nr:hypothetical protein PVAND_014037 [Polypedilum vanderplanki]
MDDNQCRTCLADATGSRYTIFKKVNGTTIDEMLQSITNLEMSQEESLSKIVCKKCFNDTISAYTFRTKCLDTNRTLSLALKSLNNKLKQIQTIKENSFSAEEVYVKNENNSEEIDHLIEYEYMEAKDSSDDEKINYKNEEVVEYIEEYEQVEYLEESFTDSTFQCTYCEPFITFKTDYGLKKHLYNEHQIGGNPLICFTCNIEFKVKPTISEEAINKSIQKHMFYHEEGKFHSCTKCFEVFNTNRQLQNHENYHHNVNVKISLIHKCKSCGTQFQSNNQLTKHVQESNCKSHFEKTFQCYICNETFTRGVTKKKHVQEMHQDKAGSDCPLCLRCKIPSAIAFENHYKTHFIAPRFCCNYCGRSFHENDRLQTHIKRSHDITKFTCFWCTKTFKDKSGITRHILGVHFNTRKYKCEICTKAFTASYNLKEHLFSVHKIASKIYTCDVCNQDFLYRKKFERHRPICTGIPEKRKR